MTCLGNSDGWCESLFQLARRSSFGLVTGRVHQKGASEEGLVLAPKVPEDLRPGAEPYQPPGYTSHVTPWQPWQAGSRTPWAVTSESCHVLPCLAHYGGVMKPRFSARGVFVARTRSIRQKGCDGS